MKKYILLLCLVTQMLFSKEVDLDGLIEELNITSYENEIYKIRQERDEKRKEIYTLDSFNGITTTVEGEYNKQDSIYKYKGRAEYGGFYIEAERWRDSEISYSYGVEKNIKDLIFSKNDSNLEKLELNKRITSIDFQNNLQLQKIELIDLYKDYKEVELEIEIRKNALKTLKKEKKILSKSYEMGAIATIELDSLLYSYKNIELEIENLKKESVNLKKQFTYLFKIDLNNKKLKKIRHLKLNLANYIENIGEINFEKMKLETEIIEKNVKYLKYNKKIPEFFLGVERNEEINDNNEEIKDNRVFIKLSKDIFYKSVELEDEKSYLVEAKINLSEKNLEIKNERLKLEKEFFELSKNVEVLSNDRALEESKYKLKKLENILGKIGYIDVMESFNDYLELKIQEEKSKNTLKAFIYIIKIRGEEKKI
jgi:hypothetical protein